jgi:hypothetical protein
MSVPDQVKGKQTDNTAGIELHDQHEAVSHFRRVSKRLFDINNWGKIAGPQSAGFRLFGPGGNEESRPLKNGDYIRIDIPGPGSSTGDGYDWVKIVNIDENKSPDVEEVQITVQPADNPQKKTNDTAHFFDSAATSTFVVRRTGGYVEASVHGRNEVPNHETADKVDKVRNTVVAAGATVFSNIQWRSLVNALIAEGD